VGTITVEGPNNKRVKVKVKDPAMLQQVKLGEQVELLITEAFAIAVETQRKWRSTRWTTRPACKSFTCTGS
jgi:ribulose bisphosphate carboxylase small subunit